MNNLINILKNSWQSTKIMKKKHKDFENQLTNNYRVKITVQNDRKLHENVKKMS